MLKLTAKRDKVFTVPQDPSGESTLTILHLKPGEVADIEAKSNQTMMKQSGDDFLTEIGFDLNARTKKFVTRSITAWTGFTDKSGKVLPCTDPNKLAVLKEFDWFGDFVEECRKELAEEVEAELEGAEEN